MRQPSSHNTTQKREEQTKPPVAKVTVHDDEASSPVNRHWWLVAVAMAVCFVENICAVYHLHYLSLLFLLFYSFTCRSTGCPMSLPVSGLLIYFTWDYLFIALLMVYCVYLSSYLSTFAATPALVPIGNHEATGAALPLLPWHCHDAPLLLSGQDQVLGQFFVCPKNVQSNTFWI